MPTYQIVVNGEITQVDAPAKRPLLWVLRETLGLTGAKYGCGVGDCGACTCLIDGEETLSCLAPVSFAAGKSVTTIEGLAQGEQLHPVQQAWIDEDVSQCGFCQPGQILSAVALLERTADAPTDDDIDQMHNICRCGTYGRIRQAIKRAAATRRGE